MTEKPNCANPNCGHPPAVHDYIGCSMIGCACEQFAFEPVAEPAEPSASPTIREQLARCKDNDRAAYERSAEPTAEGAQTCKYSPSGQHVAPRGICQYCEERVSAPQPIARMYISETKPHKVDPARIAEIFNRQPVAGEGPRVDHRKAVEDWFKLPNHDLGFRHEGCCEDTRIINTGCIFCLVITAMVAYKNESAPEGTPKLEEIAAIIYRHTNANWCALCESTSSECYCSPTLGHRVSHDAAKETLRLIRPCITPACSPPDVEQLVDEIEQGILCAATLEDPLFTVEENGDVIFTVEGRKQLSNLLANSGSQPKVYSALKRLYEETADYIRINNLGDVHHNQSMKNARDALATPASTGEGLDWISVEYGLPKTTGVYGIYPPEQIDKDQGLNFSPRYFFTNEDGNTYVGNKLAYGWVKDKNHTVTHWRELPPAPTSVPQAEPPK